jgi:uncharacterized SAM-binding protein YcdF (DUF218 family)
LGISLIAATAIAAVPSARLALLQGAGSALVGSQALEAADVIVVSTGADAAGALTAADLFHAGLSSHVAVFADPPSPEDLEFLKRGLPYENAAERSVRWLQMLGVPNATIIPRAVAGTDDEGVVLPPWCHEQQLRSVLVVTTPDHARRVRRILARAMSGQATRVIVHPSSYSRYDPNSWWQSRHGIRTQIVESQKLVLDFIRHPLS